VLVDLLRVTVLLQKTSENAASSHPEDCLRHTGIASTLSLTEAEMATC
jgi:hypothetical protein